MAGEAERLKIVYCVASSADHQMPVVKMRPIFLERICTPGASVPLPVQNELHDLLGDVRPADLLRIRHHLLRRFQRLAHRVEIPPSPIKMLGRIHPMAGPNEFFIRSIASDSPDFFQFARGNPNTLEIESFSMQYEITGDNLQMVTLRLAQGESIYAEAGAMVNMSGNMQLTTNMKGGLLKGLKRMVSGESLFMTEFVPQGGDGFVSFAGNIPGKVFSLQLAGGEFIAQKDAFLCSEQGIDLDIAFTKRLRSGAFGGEGFILERMSGSGTAFLHCCGDIIEMTLKPGEVVKVETGLVVGFESTVDYSIALAGGVKTVFFGGEGLFLTTLTGPGRVILQSMDIAKLAASLLPYLPVQNTSGR
jgi:uncharacterized protein (TIGR00266 family)